MSYRSASGDRNSQDRYRQDSDNKPASIVKRSIEYEREYSNDRQEYMRKHYPNDLYRSSSRSPPRENWRRASNSPQHNDHSQTRKSSSSPLRNKENMSPHIASPVSGGVYLPVDDPVERRSLMVQLDELKQRLHYDYSKNADEVQQLRLEKDLELNDIMSRKDALVEESHMRIHALKREIEDEERKAERIREENVIMQKNHSMRVSELQNQIEGSQQRLEQVKRDHEDAIRDQIRQQDDEKRALREDYEKLIEQVRQEYQATREELKDILNDRNDLVEQAKVKLSDLKQHYADEIDNLKKEVEYLQDSIQTSK